MADLPEQKENWHWMQKSVELAGARGREPCPWRSGWTNPDKKPAICLAISQNHPEDRVVL